MNRLELAIKEIVASRQYVIRLINDLSPNNWFRMPTEGVTHIAWQVGHLAMAEYRLCLERIRGERPSDKEMISPEFLAQFGKSSVPQSSPESYPSVDEILTVFHRVHEQTLDELPSVTDAELDRPPEKPHSLFNTKLDSLFWRARHEMLHAGQIGLLRRLSGRSPQW